MNVGCEYNQFFVQGEHGGMSPAWEMGYRALSYPMLGDQLLDNLETVLRCRPKSLEISP